MTARLTYSLGLIIVVLLLLASLYLQIFDGIMPCPLCALQRVMFAFLGVFFLFGILLHKKYWGRIIIHCFSILASLLGLFLAGRQIWLQHFKTSLGECGVSIQYMMQILPLHQVLQKIVEGSAECTKQDWTFLSINMAEWAFIWFIVFLCMSLYLFIKELRISR